MQKTEGIITGCKERIFFCVAVILLIFAAATGLTDLKSTHSNAVSYKLDRVVVLQQAGNTKKVSRDSEVKQEIVVKAKQSWPWYITRGAGLTAAALLVLLIISGIGLITGLTYKILEPITAWSVHRAIAIAFGVTGFIHVFVLLFDRYVGFSIWQLLVPFLSHYQPVTLFGRNYGSLYMAFGIFAMYIAAILLYTSLFWVDKKPVIWKILHYLSYLLVILVFVHALYLGTDLKQGFLRIIWIAMGVIVLVGIVLRIHRSRTINKKKRRAA